MKFIGLLKSGWPGVEPKGSSMSPYSILLSNNLKIQNHKLFLWKRINYHSHMQHSTFLIALLVACYATIHPALSVRPSVRRSVRPSVRPSVGPSHFDFLAFMFFLAILTSNIAPAHPHATGVAVYPALFVEILELEIDCHFDALYPVSYNSKIYQIQKSNERLEQ